MQDWILMDNDKTSVDNAGLEDDGRSLCNADMTIEDWLDFIHPTRHKIGHFGDFLSSQSAVGLGDLLKKQKLSQQNQTTQEQLMVLVKTGKTYEPESPARGLRSSPPACTASLIVGSSKAPIG